MGDASPTGTEIPSRDRASMDGGGALPAEEVADARRAMRQTWGRFYLDPIAFHRISSFLYRRKVPLLPRVVEWIGFLIFNGFVPKTATVGTDTHCADRGLSVGVHPWARIGSRVLISMQVLIGGRAQDMGPPVIEDDVFIGLRSAVLCARVGRGAVIGAGSIVVDDVPPRAVVTGSPARQIGTLARPWWQGIDYVERAADARTGAELAAIGAHGRRAEG